MLGRCFGGCSELVRRGVKGRSAILAAEKSLYGIEVVMEIPQHF